MLALIGHTFVYCGLVIIVALTAGLVGMIIRGFYEMFRHWDRTFSIQTVPAISVVAVEPKPEPKDVYSLAEMASMRDLPEEL